MGRVFSFLLITILFLNTLLFSSECIYLTYPGDPSHSMAIHWLETKALKNSKVTYKSLESDSWSSGPINSSEFGDYILMRSVLNNLEPDTDYEFYLDEETLHHRFRTLPKCLDRPLRIAIGGDAYKELSRYKKTNLQVAGLSPDFVILGGDIAYANKGNEVTRWRTFFLEWQKTMRTKEGRMIPLMAAVGNHEISSGLFKKKDKRNFFLDLFPYLEKGSYGTLDVAGKLSFFLLDTGHISPINGEQVTWLKDRLEKKEERYKIAVYHEGAYPSVYSYKGKGPTLIRNSWSPLFEEYGVLAAFENHNHAFKRTYPIKGEKVDPRGVTYIGAGCWSVSPRKTKKNLWYIDVAKTVSCFSMLTLSKEGVDIESINNKGVVFDKWMPKQEVPAPL